MWLMNKMCERLNLCSSSSLCKELFYYYYFFDFYTIVQRNGTLYGQRVLKDYITAESEYAKRDSPCRIWRCCVTRFDFIKVCIGKTVIDMCNCDILAIKCTYLNALLFFLMSSRFSARSEACVTPNNSQKRPNRHILVTRVFPGAVVDLALIAG